MKAPNFVLHSTNRDLELLNLVLESPEELTAPEVPNRRKAQRAAFSEFHTELMKQMIENEKINHVGFLQKCVMYREDLEETEELSEDPVKREELLENFDAWVDRQTALLKGIEYKANSIGKDLSIASKKRLRNKKWQIDGGGQFE